MEDKKMQGSYPRFLIMVAASMVVMYLLTYTNSWEIYGHAWFSETRAFMVLMMGGAMAIVMLTFMLGMYTNARANAAIYVGALLLMVIALVFVRTQTTVNDVYYMKGMIPHHSIAILTSTRARIKDARVRKLADSIIRAQEKEISEMSWLIDDIGTNGITATDAEAEQRPVPQVAGTE